MVNELADFAADRFSNHFADAKADKAKYYASQALLGSVCKRIAAIEASLREYATDVPFVAADIITTCEAIGEQRRTQIREITDRKVKTFASEYGHNVVFVPYVDPPNLQAMPRGSTQRRIDAGRVPSLRPWQRQLPLHQMRPQISRRYQRLLRPQLRHARPAFQHTQSAG